MSYAMKNLREISDVAAGSDFGQVQEARFARGALEAEDTGLAYHVLRPGRRQTTGHRHHQAEEIFVVLSGSGRMKLDDEIIEIGPMDAVRVAPDVTRALEAGDEPLEVLVFGPHHGGDGELVEGFWA